MIDERYLTKSEVIKTHGWTDRLVEQFLKPTAFKRNYRQESRPIKLYEKGTVEAVMKTADFQKEFAVVEHKRMIRKLKKDWKSKSGEYKC